MYIIDYFSETDVHYYLAIAEVTHFQFSDNLLCHLSINLVKLISSLPWHVNRIISVVISTILQACIAITQYSTDRCNVPTSARTHSIAGLTKLRYSSVEGHEYICSRAVSQLQLPNMMALMHDRLPLSALLSRSVITKMSPRPITKFEAYIALSLVCITLTSFRRWSLSNRSDYRLHHTN